MYKNWLLSSEASKIGLIAIMSGSVPSGLGIIVKLVVVVLVFLGLEYAGVILKLVNDSTRSLTWRIVFGLITPAVFLSGLLTSNLTGNKTINVVLIFGLVIMNSVYLLTPLNSHFSTLMYGGGNKIVSMLVITFVSIATSSILLISLVMAIYFILKEMK